jgi:hypothetical protein
LTTELPPNYTGSRIHYYPNGRIREKHYLVNGYRTHTFGYNNNEFNSLYYTWVFEQDPKVIREYIYNAQENPIAQYVIDSESKITSKIIYDRTNYLSSIYLERMIPNKKLKLRKKIVINDQI